MKIFILIDPEELFLAPEVFIPRIARVSLRGKW